jgi:hypothetical protein
MIWTKKSCKRFGEIAEEIMQQKVYIPMQQQGYDPADLEMPALNEDLPDPPDLPTLPTNKGQLPPGI